MPILTVTDPHGDSRTIMLPVGGSLMEAIRDNGFEDLLGMCGGALSCATCHVYVDDPAALAALPPMGGIEDSLLSIAERREENSRLSCQIPVTEAIDGLHVTIAPSV